MKKILICDDELMIRELVEAILEDEIQAEFEHVNDGQEAITKLSESEKFDLIICDMNMPNLNGDKVYEYNKSKLNIPFILLSGDVENLEDMPVGHESDELLKIVGKPWDADEFLEAVTSFLG